MYSLFARVAPVSTWDLQDWVIAIIVLAAVAAVVYIALEWFGIKIPQAVLRVAGIVLFALFCIFAVRLLFSA